MAYRPVEAAVKVLSIIPLLAGNEMTGLTQGQISKALNIPPAQVGHYLCTLESVGYAHQLGDTGRWCLGTRIVQIAVAFMSHIDQQQKLLDETVNRYTRGAGLQDAASAFERFKVKK